MIREGRCLSDEQKLSSFVRLEGYRVMSYTVVERYVGYVDYSSFHGKHEGKLQILAAVILVAKQFRVFKIAFSYCFCTIE